MLAPRILYCVFVGFSRAAEPPKWKSCTPHRDLAFPATFLFHPVPKNVQPSQVFVGAGLDPLCSRHAFSIVFLWDSRERPNHRSGNRLPLTGIWPLRLFRALPVGLVRPNYMRHHAIPTMEIKTPPGIVKLVFARSMTTRAGRGQCGGPPPKIVIRKRHSLTPPGKVRRSGALATRPNTEWTNAKFTIPGGVFLFHPGLRFYEFSVVHVSFSLYRCSVCLCVCLCVCPCACLCVWVSVSTCRCLSMSARVSVRVCVPACVCLCVSVCLSVSACRCLSLCLSVCLAMCLSVRLCVCLGVSPCVSPGVCPCVSLCVCVCVRVSVFVCVYVSVCLCLRVDRCLSVSVGAFGCLYCGAPTCGSRKGPRWNQKTPPGIAKLAFGRSMTTGRSRTMRGASTKN